MKKESSKGCLKSIKLAFANKNKSRISSSWSKVTNVERSRVMRQKLEIGKISLVNNQTKTTTIILVASLTLNMPKL